MGSPSFRVGFPRTGAPHAFQNGFDFFKQNLVWAIWIKFDNDTAINVRNLQVLCCGTFRDYFDATHDAIHFNRVGKSPQSRIHGVVSRIATYPLILLTFAELLIPTTETQILH
jgi:hypothetical protein